MISDLTHFLLPHANLLLCTENLTPFLSLLPSKGLSGLSSLLAQPSTVFAWGFKTEGIEVIMPSNNQPGRWRGWWEGVVDLVPVKGGGSREFSVESLFKKHLPRAFPEADESVLRVIMPGQDGLRMDKQPTVTETKWIDGKKRHVAEWDVLDEEMIGQNIRFWWDGEGRFDYRKFTHFAKPADVDLCSARTFTPPPIVISRTVTAPYAGDGVFTIRIENTGNDTRTAVYSEVWPWWVKGWLQQMSVLHVDHGSASKSTVQIDFMLTH